MRLRKRAYRVLARLRRSLSAIPQPGAVDFGDLRRVTPIGREFGLDRPLPGGERGSPVDRHYIERFLETHAGDIRGRVLEIGDDAYTRRYGGDRVARRDVLHITADNPAATIVADLADAPQIADASFDCVILTQTLHLIYDARAAVRTLHRILKPDGVLLMTVPGITLVPTASVWGHTWYWAFTGLALRRMLEEVFDPSGIEIDSAGNVLTAMAFLHGLAAQELTPQEFAATDPDFPLILAARARKGAA
ncbi:MAG: methyltransferase domain-containing protein [Steroidobacteraceae bacterium]